MENSEVVQKFISLFGRLKNFCDDQSSELKVMAKNDQSVVQLCDELESCAFTIRDDERSNPKLFRHPVNPAFIHAWRDFEERYSQVVSDIWLAQLAPEFFDENIDLVVSRSEVWVGADNTAAEEVAKIDEAVYFALNEIDPNNGRGFSESYRDTIVEGLDIWQGLTQRVGLDLRGIIRRRRLVPVVLIPGHVSAKYGVTDGLSLFEHLRQAQDAFIYGAPLAALSLMRSILEIVLRDHYGASGGSLATKIENCCGLPKEIGVSVLRRMNQLANSALHFDTSRTDELKKLSGPGLENTLAVQLHILRTLIEKAPSNIIGRRA